MNGSTRQPGRYTTLTRTTHHTPPPRRPHPANDTHAVGVLTAGRKMGARMRSAGDAKHREGSGRPKHAPSVPSRNNLDSPTSAQPGSHHAARRPHDHAPAPRRSHACARHSEPLAPPASRSRARTATSSRAVDTACGEVSRAGRPTHAAPPRTPPARPPHMHASLRLSLFALLSCPGYPILIGSR